MSKNKISIDAFNVKDKSEEGVKVELLLPDGSETGHYLMVRGADSPTFRKAQARANRANLDMLKLGKNGKKPDPADLAMRQAKAQRELVAVLVAGWSFDDEKEFSLKNVINFFEDSPQIEQQVNDFAGNQANFFNKPSND